MSTLKYVLDLSFSLSLLSLSPPVSLSSVTDNCWHAIVRAAVAFMPRSCALCDVSCRCDGAVLSALIESSIANGDLERDVTLIHRLTI